MFYLEQRDRIFKSSVLFLAIRRFISVLFAAIGFDYPEHKKKESCGANLYSRFFLSYSLAMEVKEEQTSNDTVCCICARTSATSSHQITDNFIKYKQTFVPFSEIIDQTLAFEVDFNIFRLN